VLVRSGVEEKTGEFLPPAVVAQRVAWCGDLVGGMVTDVLAARWNAPDVGQLASGVDAGEQPLPSNAWMALRRLGWTAKPAEGVKANDRVVRMAQKQAGRTLRSVHWRADVVAGILRTWPADPERRTPAEWEAVRHAIDGGRELPDNVIKARTRQIARFLKAEGRLPAGARGPTSGAGSPGRRVAPYWVAIVRPRRQPTRRVLPAESGARFKPALPQRQRDLTARGDAELAEDLVQVEFDGCRCDEHLRGDLGVDQA
jgi:hypothetical protein